MARRFQKISSTNLKVFLMYSSDNMCLTFSASDNNMNVCYIINIIRTPLWLQCVTAHSDGGGHCLLVVLANQTACWPCHPLIGKVA